MNLTLDWNAYLETAAQAAAEGIVMLKNDHHTLPLQQQEEISVFGRMQLHYYKSGTGSGGMVNVHRVIGILDGLLEAGVNVNQGLLARYRQWDSENPIQKADGWAREPWSQAEMPLSDADAENAAKTSETAICIIARTAGEEQDSFDNEGSFRLTKTEMKMLQTVRRYFKKMIVLLNVGNLIDMTEIAEVDPDAILYVWQGGMMGGKGAAAVLTGQISPSGKLPDTAALALSDYPSDANFGNTERNFYQEDIYVGYRYFETAAQDKVRYPFGFGLSYTSFSLENIASAFKNDTFTFQIKVTNTGDMAGKEVVQVYCECPQGSLGKPKRILCGFQKTKLLAPQESEIVGIRVDLDALASYDDCGATEYRFCKVLEAGKYQFHIGTDVRRTSLCLTHEIPFTMVRSVHQQAMAPVLPFTRMKPIETENGLKMTDEPVPLMEYSEENRGESIIYSSR